MNRLKQFLVYGTLFALVIFQSVQSLAEGVVVQLPLPPFFTQSIPESVDVRDLRAHASDSYHFYSELNRYFAEHSEELFGPKIKFILNGPSKGNLKDTVFSVVFTSEVVNLDQNFVQFQAKALVNSSEGGVYLRTIDIIVEGISGQLIRVQPAFPDVMLSQTQWSMSVSLIERKAVLMDVTTGFKVIYPVGVGGFTEFDPNNVQLLTPTFQGAKLNVNFAITSRTVPNYFMGKPFLRIAYWDDAYSLYAFHAVPGGGKFIRGFESHGCMRLRDKDLYELLLIIRSSKDRLVNLTINQIFQAGEVPVDHPYPLETKRYNRVKNFGTPEKPVVRRDDEGLSIMEYVYRVPPTEKLQIIQPLVIGSASQSTADLID